VFIIFQINTDAMKAADIPAFLSASFSGRIRTPTITLFPDFFGCFVSADATDIAIEPINRRTTTIYIKAVLSIKSFSDVYII
jgi:hypothetical protein